MRVRKLPEGLMLEGAGDCVFDQSRGICSGWATARVPMPPRARAVEDMFGCEALALELADKRFYHMDTALAPLPGGEVMYLPEAFTAAGRAAIRDRVAPHERIEIGIEDGCRLAANAVCLGNTLVMSDCSERLRAELEERGYRGRHHAAAVVPAQRRLGVLPDAAARPAIGSGFRRRQPCASRDARGRVRSDGLTPAVRQRANLH